MPVGGPRRIKQYGCKHCPEYITDRKKTSRSATGQARSAQLHVEINHPQFAAVWEEQLVERPPKWSVTGIQELRRRGQVAPVPAIRSEDDGSDTNEEAQEENSGRGREMAVEEVGEEQVEIDASPGIRLTPFDEAALAGDYGRDLAFLAARWRNQPHDSVCLSMYKCAKADLLDGKNRELLREASGLVGELWEARKVCREASEVLGEVAAERGLSQRELMLNYGKSEGTVAAMRDIVAMEELGDEEE